MLVHVLWWGTKKYQVQGNLINVDRLNNKLGFTYANPSLLKILILALILSLHL